MICTGDTYSIHLLTNMLMTTTEQKNENTIKKSIALIEVLEPYLVEGESDYLMAYLENTNNR